MARFAFVLKQFRLEDEGLKPRRGQSPCRQRPPGPQRRAPIDALQQHRQLCRCDRQTPVHRRWPDEPALLKALGEQTRPLPVPPYDLDKITAPTTKNSMRPVCPTLRIF